MSETSESDFIPSLEFVRAFQRLVGEVFRLNGALLEKADALAKDLEVTPARWQTIAAIRNEPLTVAAIARRLGLSRQSVQQTVNRLREQGIVAFVDNPDHRTSPLVRLTGRGQEIMAALRERQAKLTGLFTRGFGYSVEDLDDLSSQLRQLREHANEIDTVKIIEDSRGH